MSKKLEVVFNNLKDYPEKVVRGTLLSMSSRIIKRSPVDTGRFRNNWMPTFGSASKAQTNEVDPSGTKAQSNVQQLLMNFEIGQTFYLTNNLPYSNRLEFGYSQQAPQGMLRITAAEYDAEIKKQAAKL